MNVTPPDTESDGTLFGGVTDWYQEPRGRSLCFVLEIFNERHAPNTESDGTLFGGVTDWYQEPRGDLQHLVHFDIESWFLQWDSLSLMVDNDSSSSSSSETSLDSSADTLSDSASSHSSSDHSLPASSSGTRPSHHFCSLVPSTHHSSTDFERPSYDSSSASPSRKRSRPAASRSNGIEIDLEIQAEIDECIAYADALRDRGIDVRVVVAAID
nr:hypothetical protein [Tanacetum cinerariifolium]